MLKHYIVILMLVAQMCFSQTDIELRPPSDTKIGLGLIIGNSIYKGDNTRIIPVPLVYYNYDKFFIRGNILGYNFYQEDALSMSAVGRWRFDGYKDSDSKYLDGMGRRRMTLEGGIELAFNDGWGSTKLLLLNDLLGRHDGHDLILSYSKRLNFDKFSITPSAGATYRSKKLNDYYYGVKDKEQTAFREAYSPNESINPFIGLNIDYRINSSVSAIAGLNYQWLTSEITDSPIVSDKYQLMTIIGLMYSF